MQKIERQWSTLPRTMWVVLGVLCVLWWGWLMASLHGLCADDAFITFRYAENLMRGRGMVFNPGERLMGSTAPGHLLLAALVYGVFGKLWMPHVMALLGCIGWMLQGVALYVLFARRIGRSLAFLLLVILWSGCTNAAVWVTMETHLVMAAILWALVAALAGRWGAASVLAALGALIRPDAYLPAGILAGWCVFALRREPRRLWFPVLGFLVIVGPWLIFSWVYFGTPLPQSAVTKFQRVDLAGYLAHEFWFLAGRFWPSSVGLVLLAWIGWGLFGVGAVWLSRRGLWFVPLYAVGHLSAYLLLRPFVSHTWHLYPALVLFVVCGWSALWWIVQSLSTSWMRVLLWVLMAVWVVGYLSRTVGFVEHVSTSYWFGARHAVYTDVAKRMREIGQPGDRIASVEVGTLAYVGDLRMHDWGGLVTRNQVSEHKRPYEWVLVDRLYLKKVPPEARLFEVFRRNRFSAYLFRMPRKGLATRRFVAKRSSSRRVRQASSRPTTTTRSTSLPSLRGRHPQMHRGTSGPSPLRVSRAGGSMRRGLGAGCSRHRGAFSVLPDATQAKGCVWTLAGRPTRKGRRDGMRWSSRWSVPADVVRFGHGWLVADMQEHRLRVLSEHGEVSTWAGSVRGMRDGSRRRALFSRPSALAVGHERDVFVVDVGNRRLRRLSLQGKVSTWARLGPRVLQPQGLLVLSGGALLIADTRRRVIWRVGKDKVPRVWAGHGKAVVRDGPRLVAGFAGPSRIAQTADGHLWVTDTLGDALRQIKPDGMVKTVLRLPRGSQPFGIAAGKQGDIFLSLLGRHQIIRWQRRTGSFSTLAGKARWGPSFLDGPLQDALFAHPAGLVWDPLRRRLVVTEPGNHCVRVLGLP